MLVEFFNNNILQSFLKALLSSVQLPKFKVVKEGDLIFEGYYYIFNTHIIKCLTTGYIKPEINIVLNTFLGLTVIQKLLAVFDELEHYYFSSMDQNIEFKEFIRASYYSTELHKRLGEYLRLLRDLYYVDLMGMYNCFSYELFKDVYIDFNPNSKRNDIFSGTDNTKKVIAVPIKFNTKYTIAIDSRLPIYACPLLKLPSGKVSLKQVSLNYDQNLAPKLLDSQEFNNPSLISFDLTYEQGDLYKYEKYLYMILLLSSDNNSSVVVLEGDYTNSKDITIINAEYGDQTNTISLMYNPKLLEMNDGNSYAYSDTLIQYLLHNAIFNTDIIEGNITYVKQLLGFTDDVNYWTNNIKYSAYMKYLLLIKRRLWSDDDYNTEYTLQDLSKLRKNCFDVTGYIDKLIEEFLNGLT